MSGFDHTSPEELIGVLAALQAGGRALGGGTDLVREIHAGTAAPERVVGLRRLARLRDIEEMPDGGLTIGAACTLAMLEKDARLRARWTVLAEACGGAATPQIRNVATLAGCVLQRPSCAYYRNRLDCRLLGGSSCGAREGDSTHHALFGGGLCVSAHPSDAAAALLALDADVSWVTPDARVTRTSVAALHRLPDAAAPTEIALPPEALITAFHLPPPAGRSTYIQARERATWSFALVGVAARLDIRAAVIRGAGVALTAAAPIPWRLPAVEEALVGFSIRDPGWADEAAERAVREARPLGGNAYKVRLVRGLVRRALLALAEGEA